tara:strand:+ start:3269 stop:3445 length:177 start_codon:yes stop_codon:yes gene_type:complete
MPDYIVVFRDSETNRTRKLKTLQSCYSDAEKEAELISSKTEETVVSITSNHFPEVRVL